MNLTNRGSRDVAAFFDIDGTLSPPPSLERRLWRSLRAQGAIAFANYFSWFVEAIRLAPRRGVWAIQANKMYLQGVSQISHETCFRQQTGCSGAKGSLVFAEGLERLGWHAAQGHRIVLVSGTLMPLAHAFALTVTMHLAGRGIAASIGVCATRLAVGAGRCTGHILGAPIFGRYKAEAVKRVARSEGFDLPRSFAYGNSVHDHWMLAAVGRPFAVNPSLALARLAKRRGWPVVQWPGQASEPSGRITGEI